MSRTRLLVALAVLTALASPAFAGDLEPPASALTPQGAPAPSMKTLSVPPSWDQTLPANDGPDSCNSSRFKCVMAASAVLDRETGLVWERSPGNAALQGFVGTDPMQWFQAVRYCSLIVQGGRWGWRLPTFQELLSLVVGDPPSLPTGHPFSVSGTYWSATTSTTTINNREGAYFVGLGRLPDLDLAKNI